MVRWQGRFCFSRTRFYERRVLASWWTAGYRSRPTVAVLAYARSGHVVNVFIWSTREPEESTRAGARLGYQWVAWQKDNMEFCAVSDAAPAELEQLHRLFAG